MSNYRKSKIVLIFIFLAIQALTLFGLTIAAKSGFIYDLIATTVFYIAYETIECKFKLHTSNYIRTTVIISIISHNLLGNYTGLYITSPLFDTLMHIFGTYAFTLLSYSMINKGLTRPDVSKFREFLLIISLGIALGTIFEITEFLADMALKPQMPYQPSLLDTNLDLVCDVFGALLAAYDLNNRKQSSTDE